MKFIDLSHPLIQGQLPFPGDPEMSIQPFGTVPKNKFNSTQVKLGTHMGTHLDAMYHFVEDGKTLDQMPLDWFYGPARLLRIPKKGGDEITLNDFLPHERWLVPGARIIYTTGWYRHYGADDYYTQYPSLTLEAGRYLAARKIRMLGMDTPTPSRDWYEMHHIFLARDVETVLVESLTNLEQLPDEFTFVGFPLNIKGRDGSPIRAVAICP